MREGWYLMTAAEVERAVAAWRAGDHSIEIGVTLTREQAMDFKAAGNVPDDEGRSLRLVLLIDDGVPLEHKRLVHEPDYLDRPTWRRAGSKPINVLPLRVKEHRGVLGGPWWDEPRVKALEEEWRSTGMVAGISVPAEYRSFVYKTVLALQDAEKEVSIAAIADAIARWVPTNVAEEIRAALESKEAGRGPGP